MYSSKCDDKGFLLRIHQCLFKVSKTPHPVHLFD
jgi:hypothetical protein